MKKLVKLLLCGALVLSLGGTALLSALTVTLRDAFREYRQTSLNRVLSLGARVRELEDAVSVWAPSYDAPLPVPASDPSPQGADDAADDAAPCCETDTPALLYEGEVTQTPAHAAEPVNGVADDGNHADDAAEAVYILSVRDGQIGVFDEAGDLLRTVNVSVDTLPAADRAALSSGIRVEGKDALLAVIGAFE